MKDFLLFRKMLTPILIHFIFWIAIVFFVITAIIDIINHVPGRVIFQVIVIEPLIARIACEVLLTFFQINNHLRQICKKQNQLDNNNEDQEKMKESLHEENQ